MNLVTVKSVVSKKTMSEKIDLSDGLNNPDVWDDTLLIKAYDNSLKLAREEVAKRIAMSTNGSSGSSNAPQKTTSSSARQHSMREVLKVGGAAVRATYTDGVDYEAQILSVDKESGTCLLKYVGYENEQSVKLDDLLPSWGEIAVENQKRDAILAEGEDPSGSSDGQSSRNSRSQRKKPRSRINLPFGAVPPPPPMPPMLNDVNEDSEHLSAMLMSWYLSGYYTGLYQGQKMSQNKTKKRH